MSEAKRTHTINTNPKTLAVMALALFLLAGLLAYVAFKAVNPKVEPIASSPVAQVSITPTGFVPATLSIQKDTKVVFTNTDDKPHQIQANPHPTGDSLPGLKSEILNNAQTYTHTFTKAGNFTYHDHLNPSTNGTVAVKETK